MDNYILYFMVAALTINLTPGPAMLYCINTSIHHGKESGITAAIGVELGTLFYVLLTGLGLSALIIASPIMYNGLKIAGSGYLLYLAYTAFPRKDNAALVKNVDSKKGNKLLAGLFLNLMNPKILLFFLTLLPQFVPIENQSIKLFFILGLAFNISGLIVNAFAVIFSYRLKSYFSRSKKISMFLKYTPSIMFLTIAIVPLISNI